MARDRDARNTIVTALTATGAFDLVTATGLPENYGFGASKFMAAVVMPDTDTWQGGWDAQPSGGTAWIATCIVTVLAREEDPQLRDEAAEMLVSQVANAVNGQTLVPGLTVPALTRIQNWRWLPETPPERRIAVRVQWGYLEPGWATFDTST
jgi:hypothetical protein